MFSPASSLTRGLFKEEEPKWITTKPAMRDEWSVCLQTLEGHDGSVYSVAVSHDSTRLTAGSADGTVKIWDTSSNMCLQTLEGHDGSVYSVAVSRDSTRLTSRSSDKTVKIWDASSSKWLQTLEGHNRFISSVAFFYDSTRLASGSDDSTVKIWDLSSSKCLQTLDIGKVLFNISFDITGSYLHTKVGTIAIDGSSASNMIPSATDSHKPRYQGGNLSSDGAWIRYNSKNVVWLPSEYRPSCSAVSGKTIGVGVGSGKVWICNFKVNNA